MPNNKRERCMNWEQKEKELFRNVLRPYLAIIKKKDLSNNTNKEKFKAWVEITEKFNLANVRTRTKKQLMNQWKCQKLTSKKELSSHRPDLSKREGGPKPPSPSPVTIEVERGETNSCGEFEVDSNEVFSEDSYKLMHNFRVLENERQQKEHELRMKNLDLQSQIEHKQQQKEHELHMKNLHLKSQIENEQQQKEHEMRMKNLDLESQLLTKMLESYK